MKKYHDEYFTVREKRTHKKICDCGNIEDATMMLHLDIQTREIVKNKSLMSPVIDVEVPKTLPTNQITINTEPYKHHHEEWMVNKINQLPQIKLSEGQGQPVIV